MFVATGAELLHVRGRREGVALHNRVEEQEQLHELPASGRLLTRSAVERAIELGEFGATPALFFKCDDHVDGLRWKAVLSGSVEIMLGGAGKEPRLLLSD